MNLSEKPKTKRGTLSSERKRVPVERAVSHVPSWLSMKSDRSMRRHLNFRGKFTGDQRVQVERAGSPVPSSMSIKSDCSMERPTEVRGEVTGDQRVQVERAGSPVPSSLSMKSDCSMERPTEVRGEVTGDQRMGFGLRGHDIGEAIKHLATLQENPTALEQIREATSSCIHWGRILQELMQKDPIKDLFVSQPNKPMKLCQIEKIGKKLRAGKAVLVERSLDETGSRQQLSSLLSEISDWQSPPSSRVSSISDEQLAPVSSKVGMIRTGTAVGAALGFVFGVGGVLISGERDPTEVTLAGTKSTLGGAASGAAGAAAAKFLTPTFGRIGTSVVRANVLSGVAFLSVFAIWDVVEWKMHKITEVQLRQRMAEGLAGAAGGIGGGAAAGVGFGLLFGPIGALVGGIVGGLAGGVGGAFAGKAIDGAIWDESEDSVMNAYEFFGWHDVKRNERRTITAEEMAKAYNDKLEKRPSKIKEKDWEQICMASSMVLLQATYSVFTEVMKMAYDLQKNKSDGVSAVGTAMYQSISKE